MSDSPLLSKMDALLKKHRGSADDEPASPRPPAPAAAAEPAAPPGAWLPVLTQVIARGTPPPTPAATPAPAPRVAESAAPAPAPADEAPPAIVSDTLAEQLMSELAPRLSEVMEKQVAAELRKNIDQTVATLLSQLDVNVREIVRDAVAEKLKQPRDPSP
ncbi:hypothetical protein [Thiobacillus sedimenti]|uniref:DUF2497 domain-containing protein n=1 Tax=Thiobacillus sedimenti TaxID=3110231 RepID=A0ABZ1CKV6_9PROT|nr:hypothetical protein [Thiobacillus sp. SCUT-2]WRS39891.1 hypothetical protein VA613_03215 [Thiobacillus sp. SCUT-2]